MLPRVSWSVVAPMRGAVIHAYSLVLRSTFRYWGRHDDTTVDYTNPRGGWWEHGRRRPRGLWHHRRSGEGDDLSLALPTRTTRLTEMSGRRRCRQRLVARAPSRTRSPVHHGYRRAGR